MFKSKNLWRLIVQVAPAKSLSTATIFTSLMGFSNFFVKFNNFLRAWPGEEIFGPYRFLPIYFVAGAAIEFAMIHWRPNGINFYDTFKAKQAQKLARSKWEKWKEIEEKYK